MIPAVVDQSVLTWGLHKSIGDTLTYTDEQGREFKLKVVGSLENSVFQGSVLISERNFMERFPSESGTRVFLVDAPNPLARLSETIRRALRDFGLEHRAGCPAPGGVQQGAEHLPVDLPDARRIGPDSGMLRYGPGRCPERARASRRAGAASGCGIQQGDGTADPAQRASDPAGLRCLAA